MGDTEPPPRQRPHRQLRGHLRRRDCSSALVNASIVETMPGCAECAFVPYCGADPVFHYRTQGDLVGHRPTSTFCVKNMGIIRAPVRAASGEPTPSCRRAPGELGHTGTRSGGPPAGARGVSLKLHAHGEAIGFDRSVLGRVTLRGDRVRRSWRLRARHGPLATRSRMARVCRPVDRLARFPQTALTLFEGGESPAVVGLPSLNHLEAGDIVAMEPTGYVRTLYRIGSSHNAIFATDRCNSYCVMCSQPPKAVDDRGRIREHLRLVELIDPVDARAGHHGRRADSAQGRSASVDCPAARTDFRRQRSMCSRTDGSSTTESFAQRASPRSAIQT